MDGEICRSLYVSVHIRKFFAPYCTATADFDHTLLTRYILSSQIFPPQHLKGTVSENQDDLNTTSQKRSKIREEKNLFWIFFKVPQVYFRRVATFHVYCGNPPASLWKLTIDLWESIQFPVAITFEGIQYTWANKGDCWQLSRKFPSGISTTLAKLLSSGQICRGLKYSPAYPYAYVRVYYSGNICNRVDNLSTRLPEKLDIILKHLKTIRDSPPA
jgi:hypothetical protein